MGDRPRVGAVGEWSRTGGVRLLGGGGAGAGAGIGLRDVASVGERPRCPPTVAVGTGGVRRGAGCATAGGWYPSSLLVGERPLTGAAGTVLLFLRACTAASMRATCCRCSSVCGEGTPIGHARMSWQNCVNSMASLAVRL